MRCGCRASGAHRACCRVLLIAFLRFDGESCLRERPPVSRLPLGFNPAIGENFSISLPGFSTSRAGSAGAARADRVSVWYVVLRVVYAARRFAAAVRMSAH